MGRLGAFRIIFNGIYFWRVVKNTLLISFYELLFGFPAPIILALLLNEVRKTAFKRTVQTITYMPHFISLVVVCGIIKEFTMSDGLINDILAFSDGNGSLFCWSLNISDPLRNLRNLAEHRLGTIIYLAALAGIDQEQYEAAKIDGANRWRQMLNVTLPGIMPTIIILFILEIGRLMNVGARKSSCSITRLPTIRQT